MLCPIVEKAAARFAASDDLPTPPLPLATATTRVFASTEIPGVRSETPPRSFAVSTDFSSGVMTVNESETDSIPSSGLSARSTWFSKLARSGQPATVSASSTSAREPTISARRIMSSSVTDRPSSGSMTAERASSSSARVAAMRLP